MVVSSDYAADATKVQNYRSLFLRGISKESISRQASVVLDDLIKPFAAELESIVQAFPDAKCFGVSFSSTYPTEVYVADTEEGIIQEAEARYGLREPLLDYIRRRHADVLPVICV